MQVIFTNIPPGNASKSYNKKSAMNSSIFNKRVSLYNKLSENIRDAGSVKIFKQRVVYGNNKESSVRERL